MNNLKSSLTGNRNLQHPAAAGPPSPAPESRVGKWGPKASASPMIRSADRGYANPLDYRHPYESMARFAQFLALHYDANRTRHAYYRQMRLLHQHLGADPATLTEAQLRDYFLFVKLQKHWQPKTIRQAVAAARMFYVELLQRAAWTVWRLAKRAASPASYTWPPPLLSAPPKPVTQTTCKGSNSLPKVLVSGPS